MNGMGDDPLHASSTPDIRWTTANNAEALPGVQTPLGWTFWDSRFELAMRESFHDLGVFAHSEVRQPRSIGERFGALFTGRYCCNVDILCSVAARMPGTSAREVELAFLGATDPRGRYPSSRSRFPVIALKMPWTASRLRGRLARLRGATHAFWARTALRPESLADAGLARAALVEARDLFHAAMRVHVSASWLAQTSYTLLARLAVQAGEPGLERTLATGYGSLEETSMLADLWDLSRGRLERRAFIDRHGYHGPAEGDMSSRSWREDDHPVDGLVEIYRKLDDTQHPRVVESSRVREREAREADILGLLPAEARRVARLKLALARHFIPLREVGKAAFLQAIDAGRAAARALGVQLARDGRLDAAEDVFLFTLDELCAGTLPPDARSLLESRRAARLRYQELQLPKVWQGQPQPEPRAREAPAVADPEVVRGVGVSPGIVTARVAVVTDLNDASIEPGEILVCEITDPGWAPLFLAAGGLIIDVGGPLSHGAIIARELGIPCIINVQTGTRQLHSGDLVRLDGDAGIATRLQCA